MSKKILALLLALVMMLSLLTACGGSTGRRDKHAAINQDTDAIATEPPDDTKATITVATWDGGIGSQWLEQAAKAFEEKYADATHFEEGKVGVDVIIKASRSYDGSAIHLTPLKEDIYFVEAVDYYALIGNDKVIDITDVVTGSLSEYGEEGTIKDKLEPSVESFLETEGKYYAIPFYETFYSFAYDLDLWDAKSFYMTANGGWTDASGELSAGPDGAAGTIDDGMPATYDDFNKLLARMRDAGVTPFIYPGNAPDYVSNMLYEQWANYEGGEQMLMNYTFEGTATDLIEVDAEGNVTQLPATEITFENGYELQRQAGRYYTLKFCEDVMLSSEDNYKVIDTHINCQTYFINGGITNNNPVGMIVEGSWWENEAKKAFSDLESGGYERHNYRVMPMPHATADKIGQKPTWIAMSNSYGFIAKEGCKNVSLAKEFMKFLHTDVQLSAFSAETNMTRALKYEISEADQAKLSTYALSILDLKANSNVYYPVCDNPTVLDNGYYFGNFAWAWLTKVDGKETKSPWLYFKDGGEGTSAESYFAGQIDMFESKWNYF